MALLSSAELDRRIARLLQGNDARPAPYSTSPVASRRLVRLLADTLEIRTELVEDAGVVYCRMKRGGATVAAGSGETTELAVARAVANLSPATLGSPVVVTAAPAGTSRPPKGSRPATVPCEICGAPMRPPPVGIERRHCNPCSYRLLMETARNRPSSPTGS
jgi:hypothetical protein